jgi:hypothetical protein
MAHWLYIPLAASGPIGIAVWRYAPRAFLQVVGGWTKNPHRSKQCERMLALQRKNAAELLSLESMANPAPENDPPSGRQRMGRR